MEIRDDDVTGLILRVGADGTATWCLRTRTRDGRQTRPKIGTFPGKGLAQARIEARKALARIQGGGDLVAEKKEARAAREAEASKRTTAAAFYEWIEARERDRVKPLADKTAHEYRRCFVRDVLPKLGKLPLSDVTREQWVGIVSAKRRSAPVQASLLYRIVAAFLGHAEASGWVSSHPLPRKGLAALAPPPKARERALSDRELPELLRASDALTSKSRAFVRLLVLTGARESQVARIKVGDVDRVAGVWRLPADAGSKNYQERTVPLGALALEALERAWPTEDVGGDFGVLGGVAGGNFQGFSKVKSRVDDLIAQHRAKVASETGTTAEPMPPWRWHDLRRSVRSGLAAMGVPREVAELAIGHVSGRTKLERVYDRHGYEDETRTALLRWQSHVDGLLTAGGSNIVLLKRTP